jgi:hypothetical protein
MLKGLKSIVLPDRKNPNASKDDGVEPCVRSHYVYLEYMVFVFYEEESTISLMFV